MKIMHIALLSSSIVALAGCNTDKSARLADAEEKQAEELNEANADERRLAAHQAEERRDLAREHSVEVQKGSASLEEVRRERNDLGIHQADERADTRNDAIKEVAKATTNVAEAKIDVVADKVKFKEEIVARLDKVELRASSAVEKAKVSSKSKVVQDEVAKAARELSSTAKSLKAKLPDLFKDASDTTWTATKADADAQVDVLEDKIGKLEGQV